MTRISQNEKLIIVACFLCNLSQIPTLYNSRPLSLAYNFCWFALAFLLLRSERSIYVIYFALPFVFDLFCFVMKLIRGGGYTDSNFFRPINLCTFIMLIGLWIGKYITEDSLKRIGMSFVISALIVAVYLYMNVFKGVDWANSGGYLYGAKNSAGQIFLTAAVLTILLLFKEHKVLSSVAIAFFCVLIVMMKSRATILTLVIMVLYIVIFVLKDPKQKAIGIACVAIIGIIIYTNPDLYDLYINKIMLNNRDSNDIAAITSNRNLQYDYFFSVFGEYSFVGTGGTYIECMPLSVLLSYGVIGGIPVLLFSLMPLYIGLKYVRDKEYRIYCVIIIALSLMMWINGLFEEQSPFGPGVKCYFLWLMVGIFIGYKNYRELCRWNEKEGEKNND